MVFGLKKKVLNDCTGGFTTWRMTNEKRKKSLSHRHMDNSISHHRRVEEGLSSSLELLESLGGSSGTTRSNRGMTMRTKTLDIAQLRDESEEKVGKRGVK